MTSRLFARLFLAAGLIALATLLHPKANTPAQAQGVSVSVEFRQALEPHGRWHRHARYGEVWIPRDARGDWRPYTRGHWVYTEEWGWYWIADEEWGWLPYHYGRWVRDREVGWAWIPGNEWGPAWVSWRRGGDAVGWAPLPPDDIIVEIDDEPDVWIFVRSRDVIAPSVVRVLLPRPRAVVLVRETVIVNRTVFVSGARVAANVGVPPSYIAVSVGRPIRVSRVQPVVIRGTVNVRGAIEVDAKDGRRQRKAVVKQAERSIQPAKNVPEPQRLRPGETRQDTPDAPNVLRQAQPQTPDGQKKDAPATQQKQDDAAPKADQKKDAAPKADRKDDAAPKSDQRKDDRPKADRKDDTPKEQPKAKQKSDDAMPKAKQDQKDRRDDQQKGDTKDRPKADRPKADQPKSDQPKSDQPKSEQKAQPEQRMQQKRDLPDKSDQPKRDAPKGDAPKGDMRPKGDTPKSDAAPKAQPQRQEGPAQQGPGPMRDKKDN
jgi:hypothetical protein